MPDHVPLQAGETETSQEEQVRRKSLGLVGTVTASGSMPSTYPAGGNWSVLQGA